MVLVAKHGGINIFDLILSDPKYTYTGRNGDSNGIE